MDWLYLPPNQVAAINAMYQPPAVYDKDLVAFWVNCSAIPPRIGFQVSGQLFYINPVDLIQDQLDGTCVTTVRPAFTNVLGIQFFWNAIVAHDVGQGLIWLGAREHY